MPAPGLRGVLAALVLLVVAPAGATGQGRFPAEDDLELMLRYLVEDGEAPGVVLGVLDADGSTRIVAFGSPGPDGRPLGPHSRFEIGSITKTFTATLLADMVLAGEVALEDPVARYLPDQVTVPARGGREITLLDLATHRSGLPTVPDDFRSPGPESTYVYTVDRAYAFLSRYELPRDPGEAHEYSNFGFGLLGHALSRAAGSSYRELVRTRILDPLGMRGSGFADDADATERMVRGHRKGEAVRYRADMEIFDGAGALHSTAEDLLEYLKAQTGPPETRLERAMRMAWEVRDSAGQEGAGHGLAWRTVVYPGEPPVVAHGGSTAGFKAQLSFMPDSGTGVVLLANDAFFDDDLATTLLYPGPPPAEWEPARVAPEALARYVGRYRATSGSAEYYVRLEDDGFLTYQPRKRVRARLYPRSDSTFYLLRAPWSFTFRSGPEDEVGMLMTVDEREPGQQGFELTALKVESEAPPPRVVADNAGFWEARGGRAWALIGLGVVLVVAVAVLPFRRAGRRGGRAVADSTDRPFPSP